MHSISGNKKEAGSGLLRFIVLLSIAGVILAGAGHIIFRQLVLGLVQKREFRTNLDRQLASWNLTASWKAVEVHWGFKVHFLDLTLKSKHIEGSEMNLADLVFDFEAKDILKALRSSELQGRFYAMPHLEGKVGIRKAANDFGFSASFQAKSLPIKVLWLLPEVMPLPLSSCSGNINAEGHMKREAGQDLSAELEMDFEQLKIALPEFGPEPQTFRTQAKAKIKLAGRRWGLQDPIFLRDPSQAERYIWIDKNIDRDRKIMYRVKVR